MAFETFKRQRVPVTREPAVTIQRRGNLSLNPAAYDALDKPEAVELLYDRDANLVALRKTQPGSEFAYIVRALSKNSGSTWLISGMAFAAYYDINTEIARRWIGRVEGDLLVLDLNQPGVEVSGNRSRIRMPASSNGSGPHEQLPGPLSGSSTAVPQADANTYVPGDGTGRESRRERGA